MNQFERTVTEEINSPYTMNEAARLLGTSRTKLFKFLRKHNLLIGDQVSPEFLCLEYFIQWQSSISAGSGENQFSKKVKIIRVTEKGLVAIGKLIKLLNPTVL